MASNYIGYLLGGQFYCPDCVKKVPGEQQQIPVFVENILPYSQQCNDCQEVIVKGLRNLSGPINLFDLGPLKTSPIVSPKMLQEEFCRASNLWEDRDYEAYDSQVRQMTHTLLTAIRSNRITDVDKCIDFVISILERKQDD